MRKDDKLKESSQQTLMEDSIEAYNQGLIDAHSLVRRLYHNNCLEKIQKSGINISSMATLVNALIAGSVFKEETPVELKRASSAFEIYLTFRENGLIDELSAELASYNEGNISAYALARRLFQSGILDKAKEIGRNVDSMGTVAFALIAGVFALRKRRRS